MYHFVTYYIQIQIIAALTVILISSVIGISNGFINRVCTDTHPKCYTKIDRSPKCHEFLSFLCNVIRNETNTDDFVIIKSFKQK